MLKFFKFTVFSTGSFCQVYRVTDKALIAETAVWPNFFLMNIFFALKGSKLFIINGFTYFNINVSFPCQIDSVKSILQLNHVYLSYQ